MAYFNNYNNQQGNYGANNYSSNSKSNGGGAGYAYSVFKPNTDGLTMFSGDTMIRISYYDTAMKIELRLRNPDPNASSKFIKPAKLEDEIAVSLTTEAATALSDAIGKYFVPELEKRADILKNSPDAMPTKPFSIALPTSSAGNKVIEISTGTTSIDPIITLHLDINEDRVPGRSVSFQTKGTKVLVNYNGGKGDIEFIESMPQFILFMNALHIFVESAGKAACHFNKTRETAHMVDVLDRIAMQMGIPVQRALNTTGYAPKNAQVNQVNPTTVNYTNANLSDIM